jgi:hypothetical protein
MANLYCVSGNWNISSYFSRQNSKTNRTIEAYKANWGTRGSDHKY